MHEPLLGLSRATLVVSHDDGCDRPSVLITELSIFSDDTAVEMLNGQFGVSSWKPRQVSIRDIDNRRHGSPACLSKYKSGPFSYITCHSSFILFFSKKISVVLIFRYNFLSISLSVPIHQSFSPLLNSFIQS